MNRLLLLFNGYQKAMILTKISLGLFQVDATTAKCLYSSLKDSFITLGILFSYRRGWVYDGVRNFQGCINYVAKRFENENKSAISVPCIAHCVNLCLLDIARVSKCMKEALNFAMKVIQLIDYSPKQQIAFEKVQKQHEDSPTSGIQTLCSLVFS